jgi:hypothetical protein
MQFKWIEGESINDYNTSAQKWKTYSSTKEFVERFKKVTTDTTISNEDRARAVEKFLLSEAVKAGAVKQINMKKSRNPNKWIKHMAPWFRDKCR